MRFANKNVVITGAAAGLGSVIARTFADEGANVVILDRQDASELSNNIATRGRRSTSFICDIRDEEKVRSVISSAATFLNDRIDILVNNAGFNGHYELVKDVSLAHWRETLDINLTGTMLVTRSVLPYMIEKKSGVFGFTASNVSRRGLPLRGDYVCSKWALLGLVQTLALEAAPHNIRVNAVCPGPVEGDRIEDVMARTARAEDRAIAEVRKEWEEAAPLKRFVTPQEVTAAMLFLCSDAASGMTGQALNVTAGFLMT